MIKIKEELLKKCKNFVEASMKTINDIISSNQKALQSETKSSAGDKHETGRAMLQLEMEKASFQLSSVNQMKETLDKINFDTKFETVHLGSLVYTNQHNYFLAISVGRLIIADNEFFAISASSPIGSILIGKKEGDSFIFNNYKIEILAVH